MRWFTNMKIGVRLTVSFIFVAMIAAIIGGIGIYNLYTTDKNYNQLNEDFGVSLSHIADASISYQRIRVNVRDLIIEDDPDLINKAIENMNNYNKIIDEELKLFEESLWTEEGKQVFAALITAIENYREVEEKIIDLSLSNQKEQALALLKEEGKVYADSAVSYIDQLFEMKNTVGKEMSQQYSAAAVSTMITMSIIVAIGMIVAILLGVLISRSISKPISKVVSVAKEVTDGNLDAKADIKSKDELGTLAATFNRMADNLNEIMHNISAAAEQVTSGSEQLSNSSMALSQGATEQASSVEELSASIEQVSSQTRINADNAKEANKIAEDAKFKAQEGNSQMNAMIKAMEDINEASSNISKIIKVIDEIAFQTNILALNAAVEAARAGQHGKGFAVVAEEVRNLAARSAKAAKETTEMIEGSVKRVEGGTKIANDTAEALDKIVSSVTSVANLINNIASASNEQAAAITQINQGIIQISNVVQTNSATSQESAAASEELASQASMLKEQVSKFRLKNLSSSTSYKGLEDNRARTKQLTDQYEEKNKDKDLKISEQKKVILLNDNEFGKY
ncbi:MCP four helix bundle domain-containing protein [Mobilitalea sibirica]|uniref:MCP four helix bundle domain-containing protein n=1 Tax=Mobilitalea sibirica TaxID=1462919 RepID=A0A8J7H0X8_9FIRM|nr:methyl-accepting chemotaxis protein [Mobilitalea sibirica]MBH1939585.1 MCP four helix bundle domain-containing protein [Mobilitalea sibirica]